MTHTLTNDSLATEPVEVSQLVAASPWQQALVQWMYRNPVSRTSLLLEPALQKQIDEMLRGLQSLPPTWAKALLLEGGGDA